MRRLRHDDERGAAAVEFGFVALILITLVVGTVEFGRAYNVQISLTAATREGARVMAVANDHTQARAATLAAAPSVDLTGGQVSITPTHCAAGQTVTVTATYPMPFVTGLFGDGPTLTGKGVMRCGG